MAVMQNIARILQDHVSRPYLHYPSQQPWQKQPELPSSQEILEPVEPSELPRNDISGPYDSNLEYIGIQYQLLRFDAIAPIIETVREYRQAPNLDDTQNTCIYTHVR